MARSMKNLQQKFVACNGSKIKSKNRVLPRFNKASLNIKDNFAIYIVFMHLRKLRQTTFFEISNSSCTGGFSFTKLKDLRSKQ